MQVGFFAKNLSNSPLFFPIFSIFVGYYRLIYFGKSCKYM